MVKAESLGEAQLAWLREVWSLMKPGPYVRPSTWVMPSAQEKPYNLGEA